MRKKRSRSRGYLGSVRALTAVVLSFAVVSGCSGTVPFSSAQKAAANQEQAVSVQVFKASKQKMGDSLERTADVQSSVRFDIVAKAGGDVGEILKKRGDMVQKDDVIARLSSNDAGFEKQKAALAVKNAQDALDKAKATSQRDLENKKQEMAISIKKTEQALADLTRNYNKMKNDYDAGLATRSELYQAEVQITNTSLDLDQLKLKQRMLDTGDTLSALDMQLKNAQIAQQQVEETFSNLEIKSTVGGIVTDLAIEEGMTLNQGVKIGQIQKLDPIRIKAMLTQEEAEIISGKKELAYYLPGTTQIYTGKISFLSNVPDPQTKGFEINLDVPNKDMFLKPGMKLTLRLTDERDQIALAVPTSSIVKDGEEAYVFVAAGGAVEKRKVQLGRLNEPMQELISGVKEGEEVVVTNPGQLKDKQKVQWSDSN